MMYGYFLQLLNTKMKLFEISQLCRLFYHSHRRLKCTCNSLNWLTIWLYEWARLNQLIFTWLFRTQSLLVCEVIAESTKVICGFIFYFELLILYYSRSDYFTYARIIKKWFIFKMKCNFVWILLHSFTTVGQS